MRFLSPTLFRYVFKDLLKVFLQASGALAGIMSFGGLLRPLTQQGLDASQVSQMLTWLTFPMMAYSLPVAALFATAMVYGRLSADNEIVACRAGGISHLAIAMPAFVLGLVVAIISLLLMLFIAPACTLKVEKVVYSNIAKIIAGKIERTHQIKFGKATVFAERAWLPPEEEQGEGGDVQQVILETPTIVTLEVKPVDVIVRADTAASLKAAEEAVVGANKDGARVRVLGAAVGPVTAQDVEQADAQDASILTLGGSAGPDPVVHAAAARRGIEVLSYADGRAAYVDLRRGRRHRVPTDFSIAGRATLHIARGADDEQAMLSVAFSQGTRFPREFAGAQQGGVKAGHFGPIAIPSPVKENTKFMDIWQLRRLSQDLDLSRRIRGMVNGFVDHDQQATFVRLVRRGLEGEGHRVVLEGDQTYTIELTGPVAVGDRERGSELTVASAGPTGEARPVVFRIGQPGQTDATTYYAKELHLGARPDGAERRLDVLVELFDVEQQRADADTVPGGLEAVRSEMRYIDYPLSVPMPPEVVAAGSRGSAYYRNSPEASGHERQKLNRELTVLSNDIRSESHGRVSFALSCLILVMVGCALGMMFRSGNFLNAFALSFIPALLSITLIVAGQRVCGSVPLDYPKSPNPVNLGLALIWSGNAVNAVLAVFLMGKLQRR